MSEHRQRLFINLIDDTYCPDTDLVVSPSCLAEMSVESLMDFEVSFPAYDHGHGGEIVKDLASTALARIFPELNKQHNVNYSVRFWRILLMPWILQTACVVVRRCQEIEAAVSVWGDRSLTVDVAQGLPELDLGGHKDFMTRVLFDDTFSYCLRSEIIRQIAPSNWTLQTENFAEPKNKEKIPTTITKAANVEVRKTRVNRLNGMGRLQWSIVEGAARCFSTKQATTTDVGEGENTRLSHQENTVSQLFECVINAYRPDYLKDLFAPLDFEAQQIKYRSGKVFIPAPFYFQFSDLNTFVIAKACENGEIIAVHQHGGGYGYDQNYYSISEIEYKLNGFLSWGWKSHKDYLTTAIPVASPRLSSVKKHKSPQKNFLFIEGGTPLRDFRYTSPHEAKFFFVNLNNKISFLENLDKETFDHCIYKPRKESALGAWKVYNKNEYEIVFEKFKNLRTSDLDIDTLLSNAHVVIVDYLGTPLAEALSANIPTIAFWTDEQWPLAEESKVYFQRLVEAKILHKSPEKAAEHLNSIASNVEDWWQSENVQGARSGWCEQYGLRRRLWSFDWLKAIFRLISQK